jgi:hypothetical protein
MRASDYCRADGGCGVANKEPIAQAIEVSMLPRDGKKGKRARKGK